MLTISIPDKELWDEKINEFVTIKGQTLKLEHSLVSISKWESKWHKPFLSDVEKTDEEIRDYIKCMTITQNVNESVYLYLSDENLLKISNYINDSMTATWFSDIKHKQKNNKEVVTSELVYYWMVAYTIPFECEKWHFNRLMTLIQICNRKNEQPKKMSRREILNRNSRLNAQRRKQWNTKG